MPLASCEPESALPLPMLLLATVPRTIELALALSLTIICSAWLAWRKNVEPVTSKVTSASWSALTFTPLLESANAVAPATDTFSADEPAAAGRSESPLLPVNAPPLTCSVTFAVPVELSNRPAPSSPAAAGPTVDAVQFIAIVPAVGVQ